MTHPTATEIAALLRELARFCYDPMWLVNLDLGDRARAMASTGWTRRAASGRSCWPLIRAALKPASAAGRSLSGDQTHHRPAGAG